MLKFLLVIIYLINIICIISLVYYGKKPVNATLLWIFILISMPIIGFFLYYLIGKVPNFPKNNFYESINKDIPKNISEELSSGAKELIIFNQNKGNCRLTINNDITLYKDTELFYNEIINCLNNASEIINLSYYIIRNDAIGQTIKNILKQKSIIGIKVNIVYDMVGCLSVKKDFWQELKYSGINIHFFYKSKIKWINRNLNFRNHKKLMIIDNKLAFIGSANIGDEYVADLFSDCNMKIEGDCLYELNKVFEYDLKIASNVKNAYKYAMHSNIQKVNPIQIIHEIPGIDNSETLPSFIKAIYSAKKSIIIITPYLIPSESLITALTTAQKSNIDVTIVIPAISDKKIVYYTTFYYASYLIKQNITIYKTNSFIHTKSIIIDDDICTIGSYNMDYRSFYYQFELCAIIYSIETVKELKAYVKDLIKDGTLIDKTLLSKRTNKQKLLEKICRLFTKIL